MDENQGDKEPPLIVKETVLDQNGRGLLKKGLQGGRGTSI